MQIVGFMVLEAAEEQAALVLMEAQEIVALEE